MHASQTRGTSDSHLFPHRCSFASTILYICICVYLYVDVGGDIGPFQLAIGLTIVAFVLILAWEENYGDAHEAKAAATGDPDSNSSPSSSSTTTSSSAASVSFSLMDSVTDTLSLIAKYPAVLCLGLSQAFFEGAVYTFGE